MSQLQRPAAIPSDFATLDSFRGKLVIFKVTNYERNVPLPGNRDGKTADRVTADVMLADGSTQVQLFSQKVPTGRYIEGPVFPHVWLNQTRIVKAIAPNGEQSIGALVVGIVETYKPGKVAGEGNPWGLVDPTDEQYEMAAQFLAKLTASQLTGGSVPAQAAQTTADDPWAVTTEPQR